MQVGHTCSAHACCLQQQRQHTALTGDLDLINAPCCQTAVCLNYERSWPRCFWCWSEHLMASASAASRWELTQAMTSHDNLQVCMRCCLIGVVVMIGTHCRSYRTDSTPTYMTCGFIQMNHCSSIHTHALYAGAVSTAVHHPARYR
jgi:hypothetical protein